MPRSSPDNLRSIDPLAQLIQAETVGIIKASPYGFLLDNLKTTRDGRLNKLGTAKALQVRTTDVEFYLNRLAILLGSPVQPVQHNPRWPPGHPFYQPPTRHSEAKDYREQAKARNRVVRAMELERELVLVRAILAQHPDRKEQYDAWAKATGRTFRSFCRRVKLLEQDRYTDDRTQE